MARAPKSADTVAAKSLVERIRLLRPHGFIDESGVHKHWRAGLVVENASEVDLLKSRGAIYEVVE